MKATVLVNPTAGQRDSHSQLKQATEYLRTQGWELTIEETHRKGEATRLARHSAEAGAEAVLVVGGDGTLNEAANGLAKSPVALGILPQGTGNVWAAEIGLLPTPTPLHRPDLLAAARALAGGQIRRIDLGRANGRYFLLWAGVGFDAAVTREVEIDLRQMKRYLGPLAYVLAGTSIALNLHGAETTLAFPDRRIQRSSILVVISNIQLYGGAVRVALDARLDDGLFDVCIFEGKGIMSLLEHVAGVITQQHLRSPKVTYYQTPTISVKSDESLPVQVDGEPIGTIPMRFSVVPQSLNVLVPQNVPTRLFRPTNDG